MGEINRQLVRGELLARVQQVTDHSLNTGALRSIETERLEIIDQGILFGVRSIANLQRKDRAREAEARLRQAGRKVVNPFLPHDPDLYVGHLGDDHLVLLNKFNVVERHLLIVTRKFEKQTQLLGARDFSALLRCLDDIDGLGFYNGGAEAGASQAHKHLQLVPLPLGRSGPSLPIETLLPAQDDRVALASRLPFPLATVRTPPPEAGDAGQRGRLTRARYLDLLKAVGLTVEPGEIEQPGPYNLLVTRERMLLVPRCREHVAGISLNALGYAGSLLVRDATQLADLRRLGPLQFLSLGALPSS